MEGEIRKIIEKEKSRDYGLDIFLLRKYLEMADAIKNNDLRALEKSRHSIYADIQLTDLMQLIFPIKPKPMDLLGLCVKLKTERCGKYLLSEGWSWEVKVWCDAYRIGKYKMKTSFVFYTIELMLFHCTLSNCDLKIEIV